MKKKINWGFFPESPIKTRSLVEIILAVAIFVGCLYLFMHWYQVPERDVVIDVEDLNKQGMDGKYCNIYFNSMMTFDESKKDTSLRNVSIHFHKYRPPYKYWILRKNSVTLDRFKDSVNLWGDDFEFRNPRSLSGFIRENADSSTYNLIDYGKGSFVRLKQESVDSLRTFLKSKVIVDESDFNCYIKYMYRQRDILVSKDTIYDFDKKIYSLGRPGCCGEWMWGEMYLFYPENKQCYYEYKGNSKRSFCNLLGPNAIIESPNILSAWDISQSYYRFKRNF